jgi:hypothetical protein
VFASPVSVAGNGFKSGRMGLSIGERVWHGVNTGAVTVAASEETVLASLGTSFERRGLTGERASCSNFADGWLL